MQILVACVMAYLLGAVPVGRMLTRLLSGEDIWEYGNGMATFRNLLHIVGPEIAVLKTLLDFGKGVVLVLLATGAGFKGISLWLLLVALLRGCCKPLGNKGREGSGVVTGLGYLWLLWPEVGGLDLAIFWGILMLTRRIKYAVIAIIPGIVVTGLLSGSGWATATALTILTAYIGNLDRQKPLWTITGTGEKA